MPSVAEDWIVRLRVKLGIVPKTKPERGNTMLPRLPTIEPDLPLAASSTGSVAGSWERIEVYRQRAANGQAIFHPGDNRDILVRQSHCARVG